MKSFEKIDHKRDWNRLGSEKEEDTSKQILLRGGDSVEATDENTDGEEEGNEVATLGERHMLHVLHQLEPGTLGSS